MSEHSAELVAATLIRDAVRMRCNGTDEDQSCAWPECQCDPLPSALDILRAISAAGYAIAPIGAERAAGFAAGVRAGLEAAADVADKGVQAYLELSAQEQSTSERQHYLSGKSEAEMLARTIRAIDPASVKDTSDAK